LAYVESTIMQTKQSWIVTYGKAEYTNGVLTHVPTRVTQEEQQTDPSRKPFAPHTIVRSNIEFEQGTASFEVFLTDVDDRCLLLLPADFGTNQVQGSAADGTLVSWQECDLGAGVNVMGAPYGFALAKNWNWEPAGGVGHGSHPPVGRWVAIKVRVVGSSIDMYVDGVRIMSISKVLRRGQIGAFMQGEASIKLRNVQVEAHKPLCFVIMQFSPEFDILYKDVIKEVCEAYGYEVIRGDDFHHSGQILDDVTRSIRNAALIIADVTPDNANVFYELGFAHAIGKPTILLSDRKRERLPFDISGFRTLFYDNTIGGKGVVENRLKEHMEALRRR
jgi:hypothetical protein